MRNKLSKSPSKIVLYFSPALYTYNFKTKKRYKSGFYLLTCFEVLNVNSTTFATKKKRKPENDIYILPFVCFFTGSSDRQKRYFFFSNT